MVHEVVKGWRRVVLSGQGLASSSPCTTLLMAFVVRECPAVTRPGFVRIFCPSDQTRVNPLRALILFFFFLLFFFLSSSATTRLLRYPLPAATSAASLFILCRQSPTPLTGRTSKSRTSTQVTRQGLVCLAVRSLQWHKTRGTPGFIPVVASVLIPYHRWLPLLPGRTTKSRTSTQVPNQGVIWLPIISL